MKKLIAYLIFIFSINIFPQLTINGGVYYPSLTSGSFKNTLLDKNKYNFSGYFFSTGGLGVVNSDGVGYEIGFQYSNSKTNFSLYNKEYEISNSKVSLYAGPLFVEPFAISIIGELAIGWLGSNTPLDHSGVYGNMAIGISPSLFLSRYFRIFALGKLNIGYTYFSASASSLNFSNSSLSSDGLISGPELMLGMGLYF